MDLQMGTLACRKCQQPVLLVTHCVNGRRVITLSDPAQPGLDTMGVRCPHCGWYYRPRARQRLADRAQPARLTPLSALH
jgi:RNase P subunit RPR2